MNSDFFLELSNGEMMVMATALAIICSVYVRHEMLARCTSWPSLNWRGHLTSGMRTALAVAVLSCGIAVRSFTLFIWRTSGESVAGLNQPMLIAGSLLTMLGFICVIREISRPLYGNAPWAWTALSCAVFLVADVFFHLI